MEYLAREAPKAVYELEHLRRAVFGTEKQNYQRPFGGPHTEFRVKPPPLQRHLCRGRPDGSRRYLHTLLRTID